MAAVSIENLYKTFPGQQADGETTVLRRIDLEVKDGEFMVLVGPSGCGKSTLLRLLAGLEGITAGQIRVGNRTVNDLPPKQRDIAMVFQSYALYPHLTVYDNLAFGLRRMPIAGQAVGSTPLTDRSAASVGERSRSRSVSRGETASTETFEWGLERAIATTHWWEKGLVAATRRLPTGLRYVSEAERRIDQRVTTVAKMLQMDALLDRYPRQLSGGQKQRVALGRAMARNPQVFLMDEPLSNLDAKLRTETRAQIVNLQRQLGITTIYVTHDQVEAMTMGDRIAVMNQGQIQQVAAPLELYRHPANRFVAQFIGSPTMNFLPVQVSSGSLVHSGFRLLLPLSWKGCLQSYEGRPVLLGVRPEHLSLGQSTPENLLANVVHIEALGSETYLTVRFGQDQLQVKVPPDQAVGLGDEVWVAITTHQIHLFDPETEQAIG
ncbi:sugar ABC transporter ATP-binding protein [filamentous cyanobacterium CCP5]|nr:sugar ABC transporter ATP-binding protein [filamentous cyanobacterium CCP5]